MLKNLQSVYADRKTWRPCNPDYTYILLENVLQEKNLEPKEMFANRWFRSGIIELANMELKITRLHELGHFKSGWSGNLPQDQLAADLYVLESIVDRKDEVLLKLFVERALNSYDYSDKPELKSLYSLYWKTLPEALNWSTRIRWSKIEKLCKNLKGKF